MENKGLANINDAAYQKLIDNITTLWGEAKSKAIAAVNTELLDANWQTGKYIVEFEQGGKQRAEYGKKLLVNLAKDLTARNGKGFNRTNLTYMRKLYLAFPKCGTLSHKLTWSHYYELLKCDNALEMQFYYKESIKECWKVRELKRQMKSCLFQRLALSTDKAGVLALANEGHQVQTPQDIIRDPFVLEFAGLPKQKRYKEGDLEKALKDHMEQFLLEMGRGFAFVGRQYSMQIGSRQFKVDLVFYHCILKCYVLIDLKRAEIKHGDIGQMNLYLNYFKTEVCQPDDNPPIGIVLGARKDELLMEYALEGGFNNKIVYNNGISIPLQYEQNFKIAPANSVLMCIEGGSAGKKIAILNQDVCFGNKLCCFAPFWEIGKFIYYYLQSPSFVELFNLNKTGIIGGVSVAKVKEIVIPLPPVMEQQRIVAQIDRLFEQLR